MQIPGFSRRRRGPLLRSDKSTRRKLSGDGLHAKTDAVSAVHTQGESAASTVVLRADERDRGERRAVFMQRFQQSGDA